MSAEPAVLEPPAGPPRGVRLLHHRLRRSETARASGLAAATLVNNGVQLIFTVVFTRLLGATGYGSLAALVSVFLIVLVGGQALQVAAARETALGRLGGPSAVSSVYARWTVRLLAATVAAACLGTLARAPIASAVGVPEHPWAAAALAPTIPLWMLLSLQRGALQGLHELRAVGVSIVFEGGGRLALGLLLFAAGAGVTGAYAGTPLSIALTALALGLLIRRRGRTAAGPQPAGARPALRRGMRAGTLLASARIPVLALTLTAVLQNIDVIVARHGIGGARAGAYAAAAVAAKAVVWVAIGIGLYLLPEAVRRARAGLDPRPVLLRALGVLAAVSLPAMIVFAAAPALLLRLAFGPGLARASGVLLELGAAMTLLAASYLAVQYQLALGRRRFLAVIGALAVLEPVLLALGPMDLPSFAGTVLAIQACAAVALVGLGLGRRPRLA